MYTFEKEGRKFCFKEIISTFAFEIETRQDKKQTGTNKS